MANSSVLEPPTEQEAKVSRRARPLVRPKPRPLAKRTMQIVRRTHLYIGLFLAPWATLYGVTGFLFNHSTFLADSATAAYDARDLKGTALEVVPPVDEQVAAVLGALNEKNAPKIPFRLASGELRYATRDTFIATAKAGSRTFFITFDPRTASGVIRETTSKIAAQERAPFATGNAEAPRQRGMGMMGPMKRDDAGVKIPNSLTDRIKSAFPTLLERKGFPAGEITVTTAPDIKFPVEADGKVWIASYNPITTMVTGSPAPESSELSFRSFLLRMHLTRGYPGEFNTKWMWAMGVDAIALTLCFWSISGLFMWWQIKSTRTPGLAVLATSAVLAASLGWQMHSLLSS